MNSNDHLSKHESPWVRPWVYMARGWVMFLLGATLVVLTALKPHVKILSQDFSWLPVIGGLLMVVGILRCLDGFLSLRSARAGYNLHSGIFDAVVGFLVLFSVGEEPVLLALLISGYLMTQGLARVILSFVLPFRNPTSTRACGVLSLILGFLVFMQWTSPAAWFLSLSLSVEIASRGWALIQLAGALNDRSTQS